MVDKTKERLSDIMVVRSNIANHDYSIADYKLSKSESEIVLAALEEFYSNQVMVKISKQRSDIMY